MAKKKIETQTTPWWRKLLKVVTVLFLLSMFSVFLLSLVSLFLIDDFSESGNVALIKIKGPIMGDKSRGALATDGTSSAEIVKLLKKVGKKDSVKAVIIEINSPGGSAVASAEIADAVTKLNKPTVAVIREVGASGAYWVASATDKIFAHRLSMTGSIGVISSYIEYAGFLNRYNFTYQRLVAGKYKDAGSPFKPLTDEERNLFQEKLDSLHEVFIEEVALNRDLSKEHVRELATGFIFLGSEAKAEGLVDELGGRDEAIAYLEKELGIEVEIGEYKTKTTWGDILSDLQFSRGYSVGRGIGDSFLAEQEFKIRT